MKAQHTPGPWEISDKAKLCILGREDGHGRFTICVIQNPHIEAQTANARLIAAAPDLLEACRKLITALDAFYESSDDCDGNPMMQLAGTALENGHNVVMKVIK